MLYLIIILAILLFLIIFFIAPAVVIYRSVFGRRKVLPLQDEKLYKPAIEPYKEQMLSDQRYLTEQGYTRVSVTAQDGVTLCGDYYNHGSDKTALMVHGYNADPYVNLVSPARWLYDQGFNVLVIYQRAHSQSGGKHSGMGLLEKDDVFVWIDYLLAQDPSQRILPYGVSMGGTTLAYVCDTLTYENVPCMIVDCGYICTHNQLLSDAKRMHLPPLLVPFIGLLCKWNLHIDLHEKTTDHLQHAQKPILFLHGTDDRTVLIGECKANYDACSSEKRLVIVDGAEHTTAFQKGGAQVTDAVSEFINTYF